MYNKLFTKILDSSIWMENNSTRIVWITLLAAMDEDGIAHFAGIKNLAHRAIVSEEDTAKAIEVLCSSDRDSSDPEFEGKRIEKFDGGWIILNAHKYREIITKLIAREKTRIRVAEFRKRKSKGIGNADVTFSNDSVTPSDTVSISNALNTFVQFWEKYPQKKKKKEAIKIWEKLNPSQELFVTIMAALEVHMGTDDWKKDNGQFIPLPTSWLNGERWKDEIKESFNEDQSFEKALGDKSS